MWAVYAGVLKSDVREHPDGYYDRPFDVFVSYYDTGIYRLPGEWAKSHGPNRQMDWGSWLYIVDRDGLWKLIDPEKNVQQIIPAEKDGKYARTLPPIRAREIPAAEWYGVLEVECY